jgi:glycosyltransferase involved in cell wall biosynthesis
MPNVLLEAMASGLPVVATQVEGVEELLGPNSAQQTVPFGDRDNWLNAVVSIGSDHEIASALGQRNRARVSEFFSIDATIRQYEKLYLELLATDTT